MGVKVRRLFGEMSITSFHSPRKPQIELLPKKSNNLVESWYLSLIVGGFVIVCLVGLCGGFENGLLKLLVKRLAIRIQNQNILFSPKPPREMEEGNEYDKIP